MAEYDLQAPAHQPFIAGLVIAYILDFDDFQVSMNPDVVQQFVGQFDPPMELVHQVALENLSARTSPENYSISGQGDQIAIVCDIDDKFTASRILLPDLMTAWSHHIPGQMLLAIPHRDYLIAISDRDPEYVSHIRQHLESDRDHQGYALYNGFLTWEEGEVKEYRS